jgi:N-acetylglucosamine malate deacetylase 2
VRTGLTAVAGAEVLAVVAHPDDESFGLGAVLCALGDAGAHVTGLCFTRGEASTLGSGDLAEVRSEELAAASLVLGIGGVELLDYPDGGLSQVPEPELVGRVVDAARRSRAELLLVFDEGGITGHPDHRHATRAALAAADRLDLPVLAWTVPERVASALNEQYGVGFVGRADEDVDLTLTVDRRRQLAAIACHRSQSAVNPVLWRRLELTGDRERLRWLRAGARQPAATERRTSSMSSSRTFPISSSRAAGGRAPGRA